MDTAVVVAVAVAVELLPATFLHSICTNLIVCRLWQQLADSVALFHYFIYIFIYSVCLFACFVIVVILIICCFCYCYCSLWSTSDA